ncbi:histidine phosphatase family protein [Kordia sp. YSTF-M3]|uniref:Histidine phosphatase family protein n=1 Tax=Kordia aestuariivivens TaxID=2759037 RepID=A0ABR7QCY3_9FLAO|nr:phosphoglycerate mutase family protein [Kordia aestuariivivens]MBC8756199.1 histidine phosphatase family protein [Kordia aestuariivivens]
MKKNILVLLSLFLLMNCFAQESKEIEVETETEVEVETSVYYLIRHAEKDRSDKKNKDPKLTKEGNNRAVYWSDVLKNVKFDAVYSTDYNRTKETAVPTAEANELELTLYHPFKIDFKQFLANTGGKTTLIVGHSNTTPDFVNRLLNEEKFEHIDDSNNGNLYIVTITGDSKTVQLLTLN